jgi:hypothetical protein
MGDTTVVLTVTVIAPGCKGTDVDNLSRAEWEVHDAGQLADDTYTHIYLC